MVSFVVLLSKVFLLFVIIGCCTTKSVMYHLTRGWHTRCCWLLVSKKPLLLLPLLVLLVLPLLLLLLLSAGIVCVAVIIVAELPVPVPVCTGKPSCGYYP